MRYSDVASLVQVTWRKPDRTALLQQLGLCWSLASFVNFIQGRESIFMSCLFLVVPGPDASVTGYPHKNGGPQHTYLWMHQGTFLQGELGILQTNANGPFLVLMITAPGISTKRKQNNDVLWELHSDKFKESKLFGFYIFWSESLNSERPHNDFLAFGFSNLPLQ